MKISDLPEDLKIKIFCDTFKQMYPPEKLSGELSWKARCQLSCLFAALNQPDHPDIAELRRFYKELQKDAYLSNPDIDMEMVRKWMKNQEGERS